MGDNSQGQLGLSSTLSVSIPTRVSGLKGVHVISLSCSANTVMAVTRNGSAYSWGVNTSNWMIEKSSHTGGQSLIEKLWEHLPEMSSVSLCSTPRIASIFPMDDELACSAHGQCIDTDTCVCNNNYCGDRCQITSCEFTSCFGYKMTDVKNVCTGRGEWKAHGGSTRLQLSWSLCLS